MGATWLLPLIVFVVCLLIGFLVACAMMADIQWDSDKDNVWPD